MFKPSKLTLEIPTSMGKVRAATTTGSVMAPAHGASARRARNSNQLDLFGSLFIDPAQAGAPPQTEAEPTKAEHGREEPLAGNDLKPLAATPAPDGRGAAPEQSTGAGDQGSGNPNLRPSLRAAIGQKTAISGSLGTGYKGVGVPADRGPPLARLLFDADPITPDPPSRDFQITGAHRIGQGTLHEKARDNLSAIKTLKTLEAENRDATDPEKAILARYVGWGSMPNAFSTFP